MKEIPVRTIREPDFSGSFTITDLGELLIGRDMAEDIHRHNFFFLLVIKSGTGAHQIDFTEYPVSSGSFFFIRPGQTHQLSLDRGTTGYLMAFEPGFYSPGEEQKKQVFRKVSRNNYYNLNAGALGKLVPLMEYNFREYSQKQAGYKEIIKANLEIFFIEAARLVQISDNRLNSLPYAQERLEQLSELLETHICVNKQVADYADMLHITPYQLNSITKSTLGKTCSQLIDEQIILEAKRSLLATTKQINEIAFHLCYEDPSYFIRFFKKHTGFTPETFRKNFK
jgi:AraC-like DNA-binding protein